MPQDQIEDLLESLEIFAHLAVVERRKVAARFRPLRLARGALLVRQGDEADAMFIVVSGRFAVTLDGRATPLAEIGPGQPIGEMAFLGGGTRTANVVALRDSLVLELKRADFDALTTESPALWRLITKALARRVADLNAARPPPPDPRPRTIALIPAGGSEVPAGFVSALASALSRATQQRVQRGRSVRVVDRSDGVRSLLPSGTPLESDEATARLNTLERESDFVILVADSELSAWSEKAIRQADLVLHVARFASAPGPNPIERRAAELLPATSRRLVLLHAARQQISGTRRWLHGRDVAMHHHVAPGDADVIRLARFIKGTAVGLIACGGGALCTAQIGLHRALTEAGVSFDIMGGTSGGSAYAAAFALGRQADEIEAATHEMFVKNKAMRRLTWPRYSLIDHTRFDAELQRLYGGQDIEDLWIPYFAISSNLSSNTLHLHRSGELWSAVRASAAIPVILPPYYTSDGHMLVDGCLLDNVPIRAMHELKSGPNVVMSFEVPELERFDVSYDLLPSRARLVAQTFNPFRRHANPPAPGVMSVLLRSLMANRQDFTRHMQEDDVLVIPPLPDDMSFLDWHRHGEIVALSHAWARAELDREGSALHGWRNTLCLDGLGNDQPGAVPVEHTAAR